MSVFKTQTRLMDPTRSECQTTPTEPVTWRHTTCRTEESNCFFSQLDRWSRSREHTRTASFQHLPRALTCHLQYAPQRWSLRDTSLLSTPLQRDMPQEDTRMHANSTRSVRLQIRLPADAPGCLTGNLTDRSVRSAPTRFIQAIVFLCSRISL